MIYLDYEDNKTQQEESQSAKRVLQIEKTAHLHRSYDAPSMVQCPFAWEGNIQEVPARSFIYGHLFNS